MYVTPCNRYYVILLHPFGDAVCNRVTGALFFHDALRWSVSLWSHTDCSNHRARNVCQFPSEGPAGSFLVVPHRSLRKWLPICLRRGTAASFLGFLIYPLAEPRDGAKTQRPSAFSFHFTGGAQYEKWYFQVGQHNCFSNKKRPPPSAASTVREVRLRLLRDGLKKVHANTWAIARF